MTKVEVAAIQAELERANRAEADRDQMILRGDLWKERANRAELEVVRLKRMILERERVAEKYCAMLDLMVQEKEENPGPDRAELAPQPEEEPKTIEIKTDLGWWTKR